MPSADAAIAGSVATKKRVVRRRRKFLACDACSHRKIKCDRALPKCNWCSHHNLSCSYTRNQGPQQRQNPSVPSVVEEVGKLIDSSHAAASADKEATDSLHNFSPAASAPGLLLGNIYAFNGVPFFSLPGRQWIQAQTGEYVNLAHYIPPGRIRTLNHSVAQDDALPQTATSLPDENLLRRHLSLYTASNFSHIFPFIDPPLFEHTIEAAYWESGDVDGTASACVYAVMSLASVVSNGLDDEELASIDDYASRAFRLLHGFVGDSINVDGLQVILILCFYGQAVAGDLLSMEFLLSAATRFVFHLRGHIRPSQTDTRLTRHIRNLFWICYLFSQESTMRTGIPSSIADTDCDLSLPQDPETSPEFLLLIRLGLIQSQTYRKLYVPSAMVQTDAELLCTIRELDKLLEDWKLSIPVNTRPTFTSRPADAESMPSSVLQIQYHYCMATIHQASGRCTSWTENQNTSGRGSSLAISVEASRSLLRKFSRLELQFHQYNLLFYLPYLTAAMIHLFCNILVYPLSPSSHDDLDLIQMVPAHMVVQLRPEASAAFEMQVEYVRKLGIEIQRLSRKAMSNSPKQGTLSVPGTLAGS